MKSWSIVKPVDDILGSAKTVFIVKIRVIVKNKK